MVNKNVRLTKINKKKERDVSAMQKDSLFLLSFPSKGLGMGTKKGPHPSVFLMDGQGPKTMGWMLLKDLLPLDG